MKQMLIGLCTITAIIFLFSACGGSKKDTQAPIGSSVPATAEETGEPIEENAEEEDLTDRPVEPSVTLRSEYRNVTGQEAEAMVKRLGFHTNNANLKPYGKFVHQYALKNFNGEKVIVDYVTGLMWHPSGSDRDITYAEIDGWLADLNGYTYAGFSDWRLPTLEEAASLIEDSEKNGYLRIDPLFSEKQHDIWTGDFLSDPDLRAMDNEGNDIGPYPPAQWQVGFRNAGINPNNRNSPCSLRPVRSLQ